MSVGLGVGGWAFAAASASLAALAVLAVLAAAPAPPGGGGSGGLDVLVAYRVAHELVGAVREEAVEAGGGGGLWAAEAAEVAGFIDEGWVVLEVNVTVVNRSPRAYVLQSGGPCSMLPGAPGVFVPLDEDYNDLWPRLEAAEGGYHEPRVLMCGAALRRSTLNPGGSVTYTFYYLVSPDFKGTIEAWAVACPAKAAGDPFDDARPGSCVRLSAQAWVDVAQALEASASR